MALYTPFIERNIDKLANAINDGQQKKLAESAYMGDEAAMGQLAGLNPQLAQQIQQGKARDEQQKLQGQAMKQQMKERQQEQVTEIAKNAAKMPFDQAAAYAARTAQELGIQAPPLTPEIHAQFISAFGDKLTKFQEAQLANKDSSRNEITPYQQAQLDIQNRRIDEQSQINDARINKLENPAEKPLNDSQSKALVFGSRMQEADKIINDMATKGITRKSDLKTVAEGVPLLGGALGALANTAQSDEQQQIEQSQRDFINAVLRRESGASISAPEFDNAKKQYFPSIGDSEAVMKQKAANRALATNSMLQEVPEKHRFSMSAKPTQKTGGVMHVDAAGNKAIVYPDGSFEEVQ